MLLATTIGVLTFTLVISLVNSLPAARLSREVAEPVSGPQRDTFSVTPIRGSTRSKPIPGVRVDQCVTLSGSPSSIPTNLQINNEDDSLSSFTLKGYSTPSCADPSLVDEKRMEEFQSVYTLNARRPICSLSLGLNPFPDKPVKVSLAYHDQAGMSTKELQFENTSHCENLCGSDLAWSARFPEFLRILELTGDEANNHVKLYSGSGCQEGTRLSDTLGQVDIDHDTDLVRMTQITQRATHFMISRSV